MMPPYSAGYWKARIRSHAPLLFRLLKRLKALWFPAPPGHPHFKTYAVTIHQPLQPNRKKLLHVIANFWTGGSAQLIVDLMERLGHAYEQAVLTRDVPPTPAYSGFPLQVLTEPESETPYLAALRQFAPDIVHVHYLGHERDEWGRADKQWYATFFKAAEVFGCPVVENINIPTHPLVHPGVRQYVYVSRYVQDEFQPPGQSGMVIYPGSDFAHFDRIPEAQITDNCIGMVYRLERDKLNEAAIDVFIETIQRRPQTRALIVGGGNLMEPFRQAVSRAGLTRSFTFTGYVAYDQLPRYYQQMSVFVAPVHRESFGQVTPFAMHMGLPVAGYRVGALEEIIGKDELLAHPGDAAGLAERLARLLDDREKRQEIGRANHDRARAQFSVETMIEAYREVYAGQGTSLPPQQS